MKNRNRRNPDDAATHERVAMVLEAASAPADPGPVPGEAEAVAAFRASLDPTRRTSMISSRSTAKVAVAAALGTGLLLSGGVAAAATGTLPGAAQQTAHDVLAGLGIEVPAGERADEHADQRGASDQGEEETSETGPTDGDDAAAEGTDTTEDTTEGEDDAETDAGKGEKVSELAKADYDTGAERGATVSQFASGGKSRAGDEHGKKPADDTEGVGAGTAADERRNDDEARSRTRPEAPEQAAAPDRERGEGRGSAPVDTPNQGGTNTADQATAAKADGAAAQGTEKAAEKSGARSTQGAANRP